MVADVIDGRAVAERLKGEVATERAALRGDGLPIGLATVLVGAPYAATAYERRLRRLAAELDVPYTGTALPATASEDDVLVAVAELNENPGISGILLLRPLPDRMDEATVFRALDPLKDIEAVHPENAGLLALGVPRYVPSTAAASFDVLDEWLDSAGEDRADFYHRSHIVVVGRSGNVGTPVVSLACARGATVESVDVWASRTFRLGRHTRRADVLVVAAGRAELIKAEHVRAGAVVIDVGINPVTTEDGRTAMVGDVDFDAVVLRARAITPVPGGVGPVTDVWLLRNTVIAARRIADAARPARPARPAQMRSAS